MTLSKVLETFAVTGKSTIVVEVLPEGKIRATSLSWTESKVLLRDQVLEVRSIASRIRVARKVREYERSRPQTVAQHLRFLRAQ